MRVLLIEDEKKFSIEVGDGVPGGSGAAGAGARRRPIEGAGESDAEGEDEMGLAVISGLVDDVEVTSGESGGVIRMSWPTARRHPHCPSARGALLPRSGRHAPELAGVPWHAVRLRAAAPRRMPPRR